MLCLFVILIPLCFSAASVETAAAEAEFLGLLNAYRVEQGIAPLVRTDVLDQAASWMATDMAVNGRFSHTDSLGRSFQDRARPTAGPGISQGENLGYGANAGKEIFDLWKDSSLHNMAMLMPEFKCVGVARMYQPDNWRKWFWAVEFGQ